MGLWLMVAIGCDSRGVNPPIVLSNELSWKEGGEAEVKAYLRALQADEVFVTYQSSGYRWEEKNAGGVVEVVVRDSRRYADGSEKLRYLMAERVAQVLWDDLALKVAEQVSIIFRDGEGRLVGDHLFSDENLMETPPLLHQ